MTNNQRINGRDNRYQPIPTYNPDYPQFDANNQSSFQNIPSLDSLGPANSIPNFPNFDANDPSTFQGIPNLDSLGSAQKLPKKNGFNWLGKDGVLIPSLETFGAASAAYIGLEQLKLNKETFKFNKDLTKANFGNQAQTTNNAIEDRSRAGAVQSGESGSSLDQVVAHRTANRRVRASI